MITGPGGEVVTEETVTTPTQTVVSNDWGTAYQVTEAEYTDPGVQEYLESIGAPGVQSDPVPVSFEPVVTEEFVNPQYEYTPWSTPQYVEYTAPYYDPAPGVYSEGGITPSNLPGTIQPDYQSPTAEPRAMTQAELDQYLFESEQGRYQDSFMGIPGASNPFEAVGGAWFGGGTYGDGTTPMGGVELGGDGLFGDMGDMFQLMTQMMPMILMMSMFGMIGNLTRSFR